MNKLVIGNVLSIAQHLPPLILLLKTLNDLRQPHSSRTLLLSWISFLSLLLAHRSLTDTYKLTSQVFPVVSCLFKFVIVFCPQSAKQNIANKITTGRNTCIKLHPARLCTSIKQGVALAVINVGTKVVGRMVSLLSDEQKSQVRQKVLAGVFQETPKESKEEEVQCEIISYKPPEVRSSLSALKPHTMTSRTIEPTSETKAKLNTSLQPKPSTPFYNPSTQREKQRPVPLIEVTSLQKSDIVLTEEGTPRQKPYNPVFPTSIKAPNLKESPQRDLTSSYNLEMSQFSDLIDEEEEKPRDTRPKQPFHSPQPQIPTKPLLSKVQIYMESRNDPSKLEKLWMQLYEGDELRILTLNNCLIETIILLKITGNKNQYFTARGYSSVSGMSSRTFKFRGDYSAFTKYIEE